MRKKLYKTQIDQNILRSTTSQTDPDITNKLMILSIKINVAETITDAVKNEFATKTRKINE